MTKKQSAPPSTSSLNYELTVATDDETASVESAGGSGIIYAFPKDICDWMNAHPLARSELKGDRARLGRDAVHLSLFNDTKLIQWWGRCSDGYYRPIGRVMKLVQVVG